MSRDVPGTRRTRRGSKPILRRVSSLEDELRSSQGSGGELDRAAIEIVEAVRERGEAALREYAERLGDLEPGAPMVLDRAALDAARDGLPTEQRELLERTAARLRDFASAQRDSLSDLSVELPGGRAGHRARPTRSAGCYAPGGRFPLPSSVLMTAVTARAAGVPTVWVASPRPAQVTLAAASIADADGFLAVGGAQAVAALASSLSKRMRHSMDACKAGPPHFMHLQATDGTLVMVPAPDGVLVVTVGDARMNVGLVRLEMLRAAEALP